MPPLRRDLLSFWSRKDRTRPAVPEVRLGPGPVLPGPSSQDQAENRGVAGRWVPSRRLCGLSMIRFSSPHPRFYSTRRLTGTWPYPERPGQSRVPEPDRWTHENSQDVQRRAQLRAADSAVDDHLVGHSADSQSSSPRSDNGQTILKTSRQAAKTCRDLGFWVGATGIEPVTPRL